MWIRQNPAKLALALLLTAAIGMTAACGKNNAGNHAAGGPDNGMNAKGYSDDGYLGITSSNPHIPGRHMALNYQNDARLMRDAVADVPGVAGANITFSGPEAYVTLKIRPDWDDRRIPSTERQAAAVLRFNFPRYNVHVRSSR